MSVGGEKKPGKPSRGVGGWDRGQGWGRGWGGGGQNPRQGNRLRVTRSPGDTTGHRGVVLCLDHVLDVYPPRAHQSQGTHIHRHRVWDGPALGAARPGCGREALSLCTGSSKRVDAGGVRTPLSLPIRETRGGGGREAADSSPRAPRRAASAPRPASSLRSRVTI